MKINDMIADRDGQVIFVREQDSIQSIAQLLKLENIGCVPVRDADGALVGILSERDLARCIADTDDRIKDLRAFDLMTKNVITCDIGDDIQSAGSKMAKHHIRHLPVMDGDKIVGMISSRDVMRATLSEVTMERNVLRDIALTR